MDLNLLTYLLLFVTGLQLHQKRGDKIQRKSFRHPVYSDRRSPGGLVHQLMQAGFIERLIPGLLLFVFLYTLFMKNLDTVSQDQNGRSHINGFFFIIQDIKTGGHTVKGEIVSRVSLKASSYPIMLSFFISPALPYLSFFLTCASRQSLSDPSHIG